MPTDPAQIARHAAAWSADSARRARRHARTVRQDYAAAYAEYVAAHTARRDTEYRAYAHALSAWEDDGGSTD